MASLIESIRQTNPRTKASSFAIPVATQRKVERDSLKGWRDGRKADDQPIPEDGGADDLRAVPRAKKSS